MCEGRETGRKTVLKDFKKRVRMATISEARAPWPKTKGTEYLTPCEAAGFCVCNEDQKHLCEVKRIMCGKVCNGRKGEQHALVKSGDTVMKITSEVGCDWLPTAGIQSGDIKEC